MHVAGCCRTKAPRKQLQDGAYRVEDELKESERDNYAFVVRDGDNKSSGVVGLIVRGVELRMFLSIPKHHVI